MRSEEKMLHYVLHDRMRCLSDFDTHIIQTGTLTSLRQIHNSFFILSKGS